MVAQSTRRNRSGQTNAGAGQSQGQVARAMAKPGELVSEYPVSSVLLVFGVGLGVGFVLGQALCESFVPPPETTAQRWGRQMYDTFSHMVPEAVSRRMAS
jgi:hypothetical protein